MELESVIKNINIVKSVGGLFDVSFSGQSCLTIYECMDGLVWKIDPVFAKLTYGANIMEDIPMCTESYSSPEKAIESGLIVLHDIGVFSKIYEFPEDTYAATMSEMVQDVAAYVSASGNTVLESTNLMNSTLKLIREGQFYADSTIITEGFNDDDYYIADPKTKSVVKNIGKHKVEYNYRRNLTDDPQFATYLKKYPGHEVVKGMNARYTHKIVSEATTEHRDYAKWVNGVLAKHPEKKIKFKGRVEKGVHTTSAEIPGKDRSYGVWDHAENRGHVFESEIEISELSNELLARYKKAAGADATAKDKLGKYRDADKKFSGIMKATKKQFANDSKKVDESKQIPIEGHDYHKKTNAELHYIMKDASDAAKAMQSHSPKSELKYLDQVNDAATVLGYRKRNNIQDYVKPKKVDEAAALEEKEFVVHYTKDGVAKKESHYAVVPHGIEKKFNDKHAARPLGPKHKITDITLDGKSVMSKSVSEASDAHIEQTLADADINSKVGDGTVQVHKDNLSKTKSILKKLAVTHKVTSGLNERIVEPQGHLETADPITDDSNRQGRIKKQMGNRTPLQLIAKILAK